jgi:hypothetical protein
MRSIADGQGHANQCTYYSWGDLIRKPTGSGTVDWVESGTPKHYAHDVAPAYLANELDGGIGGSSGITVLRNYFYLIPFVGWAGTVNETPGTNYTKYLEVRPLWAEPE